MDKQVDTVGPDFQDSQSGSSHQYQNNLFERVKTQMTINGHNIWIYLQLKKSSKCGPLNHLKEQSYFCSRRMDVGGLHKVTSIFSLKNV